MVQVNHPFYYRVEVTGLVAIGAVQLGQQDLQLALLPHLPGVRQGLLYRGGKRLGPAGEDNTSTGISKPVSSPS